MSQTLEQHQLAVELLEALNLTDIRLEQRADDSYNFTGWDSPLTETNGAAKTLKRGILRLRKRRL
jgi:hypothetical protein